MPPRRISAPLAIALCILGVAAGALPALAMATSHRPAAHKTAVRHTTIHQTIRRHATRRGVTGPLPLPAVNAAAASGTPSGVAMPTGDIPGWHQVLADDFSGSALDDS